jgi:hypothetical protein
MNVCRDSTNHSRLHGIYPVTRLGPLPELPR